jgi:hypothetical protein
MSVESSLAATESLGIGGQSIGSETRMTPEENSVKELYDEVEFLCACLRDLEPLLMDAEADRESGIAPTRVRLEALLAKARGE